mgnify:FL=1
MVGFEIVISWGQNNGLVSNAAGHSYYALLTNNMVLDLNLGLMMLDRAKSTFFLSNQVTRRTTQWLNSIDVTSKS